MQNCASCGGACADCAQCATCEKYFDYACAGITEKGYRNLGPNRRATWKCPQCKITGSPKPADGSTPTTSIILEELRDLKKQLIGLPSVIESIKTMKEDIASLTSSLEHAQASIDDHEGKFTTMIAQVSVLEDKSKIVDSMRAELDELKQELEAKDQWFRLSNAEIKGVPTKKSENLFSIIEAISSVVGYTFPKSQINYVARVPIQNSTEKYIVVSFNNRYIKEEFVAAVRAFKSLKLANIPGFQGSEGQIYVNDHLTPSAKQLLTKTKKMAKDKGYEYVWVKYAKIHVRKNNTSKVHIIAKVNDLNKLA